VQPADIRVVAREVAPDAVVAAPGPQPGLEAPIHSDPTATAVFSLPQTKAPRARLAVTDPDGRQRSIPIEGDLTIGRAEDNNLVARDGSVSRHHGRIVARRGTLVYVDLGSTNGSRVNGESVSEVVLGVGDQIEIGETTLLLEVAEDAP
jgi:pSer/pThr/pTyr-binding forkhead associated (FHA) protein